MKILVYCWGGFNERILKTQLEKLGHAAYEFKQECVDYNTDMNLASNMMAEIHKRAIDAVFSWNFFPIVAALCNAVGIRYYSWVYDSPHLTLFSNASRYDTNVIGVFDKMLADKLKNEGVSGVHYVPLATDGDDFNQRIRAGSARFRNVDKDGACDVSFVGSLYTDALKTDYYDNFRKSISGGRSRVGTKGAEGGYEETLWENCDKLVEEQCFNKREDLFTDNPEIDYGYFERLMLDNGADLGPDYFADIKDIVISRIFERKVTVEERRKLIGAVAGFCNGDYRFNLYTNSDTSGHYYINKANRGPVDNMTEMPRVFHNSKINLHITLRSIKSGIPLRALDVLGCGGFLLSDVQEDILEYFEPGKDLDVYSDPEECTDKIRYYMEHDRERIAIAQKGHKKATEEFTYEKMLKRLLGCDSSR